jgi:hypothetical protein
MDETSFAALRNLEINFNYTQLRAMLAKHSGRDVSAGFEFAPKNATMISGGGA